MFVCLFVSFDIFWHKQTENWETNWTDWRLDFCCFLFVWLVGCLVKNIRWINWWNSSARQKKIQFSNIDNENKFDDNISFVLFCYHRSFVNQTVNKQTNQKIFSRETFVSELKVWHIWGMEKRVSNNMNILFVCLFDVREPGFFKIGFF